MIGRKYHEIESNYLFTTSYVFITPIHKRWHFYSMVLKIRHIYLDKNVVFDIGEKTPYNLLMQGTSYFCNGVCSWLVCWLIHILPSNLLLVKNEFSLFITSVFFSQKNYKRLLTLYYIHYLFFLRWDKESKY